MVKYIGFDATEDHRTKSGGSYDVRTTCQTCEGRGHSKAKKLPCKTCRGTGRLMYDVQYPLRQWGWDRTRLKQVISDEGLPIPVKSACFFCPASKEREIISLSSITLKQSLVLEDRFLTGKHSSKITSTKGLGRNKRWSDVVSHHEQPKLF